MTPLTSTPRRNVRRSISTLALGLALTACGGGSGNTTNTSGSTDAIGGTDTLANAQAQALRTALAGGDTHAVELATALQAAQSELSAQISADASVQRAVWALNADATLSASSPSAIEWDPSHDSATFTLLDSGRNHTLLAGNWRFSDSTAGTGQVLAVAGTTPGGTARYAAFGNNPLAVRGNAGMDTLLRNTLGWLTAGKDLSTARVVTAQLPGNTTYWFQHERRTNAWLAAQYPGITINGVPGAQATGEDSCDAGLLAGCLANADLLVIGRMQGTSAAYGAPDVYPSGTTTDTLMATVAAAQARGIPVLYLHHDGGTNALADRMLTSFGLSSSDNYWDQEGLHAYTPASPVAPPAALTELQALLQRLSAGNFSTDWSGCVNNLGRVQCEPSSSVTGNATLMSEFVTPAKALRTRLRALDATGLPLFEQPGYALEKRLVLLGDKYREHVVYPMAKETAGAAFFRAWFSDMSAYLTRSHASAAANQGNFSDAFAADLPTASGSVNTSALASGTREYMTGYYALPGRAITLRRNDAQSAVAVTVGVNLLRDTTPIYNNYDRPTMLASPRVPLAAGGTLTLTSPFGGPVYLFVSAAAGAPAVNVSIEGAISHPVLRDASDPAQVAAFQTAVANTPTRWVGVSTDFLTLHSKLDRFQTSMAGYGGDVARLSADIWTWMIKDTYELAGFNAGSSGTFSLPANVSAFCSSAGWDCTGSQHRRDTMQHVVADNHANCGSGCSGNPYDQDWALDPLGWGETHEIGHGIQPARLRIFGSQSGEVSNNVFPMHKQMAWNRSTHPATPLTRGGTGAKLAFDVILASLATADPTADVYSKRWSDTSYAANNGFRLSFYRQLVEYARYYNPSTFSDGWELYTLLYLLDRNVEAASSTWSASAAGLGFGAYSGTASSMSGNDFMLMASSRIIGRDMRPVFALWGIAPSAAASAQVAAYALPAAAKLLFPMDNVNQFGSGVGAPITMSSSATYPSGY
jgi:hypothetical protein